MFTGEVLNSKEDCGRLLELGNLFNLSLDLVKRKLSRLLGKFFLSNLVFASAGKVMQSVWTHHVIEHCGYVYSACLLLLRVLC
jgi:hypothetical protein